MTTRRLSSLTARSGSLTRSPRASVRGAVAVPLSHHARNGVVLPLAVSPEGGPIEFHVSPIAGCSSMAKANATTAAQRVGAADAVRGRYTHGMTAKGAYTRFQPAPPLPRVC